MESLLLAFPFVCKSWHEATLSPLCWTCLKFPDHKPYPLFVDKAEDIATPPRSFGPFYEKFIDQYGIDKSRFSITAFIKMVVDRSKGQATLLKLPQFITEAALRYVSDACPLLKHLTFEDNLVIFKHYQILPEVIGKWKFLESLLLVLIHQHFNIGKTFSKYFWGLLTLEMETPSCDNVLERIIVQIGTHCKHFWQPSLVLTHLCQVEALAIVNFLPQLGNILAVRCIIERDSILTIARGCKELQGFHAKECAGFGEDDEEVYKLAGETGKIVCEDCVLDDELLTLLVIRRPTLLRRLMILMFRLLGH